MNNKYENTFIQFRTFIYQAKRIYGYLRLTKEGLEGEYIRLNKKDLLNRLDSLYLNIIKLLLLCLLIFIIMIFYN